MSTRLVRIAMLIAVGTIYFAVNARPASSSPLLMSEDAYRLPYQHDVSPSIKLTRGNFDPGKASHKGREAFAFDFAQEGNTTFTVAAARSGRVLDVREDQPSGCNKPNCSNYIVISHEPDDGTTDLYLHLEGDSVIPQIGDWVHRGCPIATADDTGKSTDNHLHFVRVEMPQRTGWPHVATKSVPITDPPTSIGFDDVAGGGSAVHEASHYVRVQQRSSPPMWRCRFLRIGGWTVIGTKPALLCKPNLKRRGYVGWNHPNRKRRGACHNRHRDVTRWCAIWGILREPLRD